MNKVLIALDYGPVAQKVAEAGSSLAKSLNSEVVLLHVLADASYYATPQYSTIMGFTNFDVNEFNQMIDIEGLKKAGGYFLDKIKSYIGDENITTIIEEGDDISEAILKTAHRVGAEIIVMGSHSRRWLEQVLVGSVTEDVLHGTDLPLLIIPVKDVKVK
jgi:nucleotide-binding universal stress UspA family protein